MISPLLRSANCTTSGSGPDVGLPVKSALNSFEILVVVELPGMVVVVVLDCTEVVVVDTDVVVVVGITEVVVEVG